MLFYIKHLPIKLRQNLIFTATLSLSGLLLTGCFNNSSNLKPSTTTANTYPQVNPANNSVNNSVSKPIDRTNKPNIIIFYVDDLGYGDVGSYGAAGVKTPNIDQLAANGIRYTDAHSSSATCTPSRYSLLTGEYAFRNKAIKLQANTALIVPTNKETLPKMLKIAGYETAVIGKWHLGLGNGKQPINWNEAVSPGPLEIGFDYSFVIPTTTDTVPSVYLENGHVINLDKNDPIEVSYQVKLGNRPTGSQQPELLKQIADTQHNNSIINGISRIGWMKGGMAAEWKEENFYQTFTNMANFFIEDNQEAPFFLFFSFHDIHVPRLVNEQFKGKSSMGPRGDAIAQMDWITGQVINKLEGLNLLNDTLIIFTSDNGPILNDGYEDQAIEKLGDHKPAGHYRGGKYSAYEAGTRVPTIVHYPSKVRAGTSNALMSQIDIYASLAALLQIDLATDEAIDSENHLNAWLSHNGKGRKELIEESYTLSLRNDNLKYIAPSKVNLTWIKKDKSIESGLFSTPQLFDLNTDISEKNNIANIMPDKITELEGKLNTIVTRTTRTK